MQLSFLPHQGEINPQYPPLLHTRSSITKLCFFQTLGICRLAVPKGKKSQFPRQCRDKLTLSNPFSESRTGTALQALPPSHEPSLPGIALRSQPRGPSGAEGRTLRRPLCPRTYRALLPAAPPRRWMDGTAGLGWELLLSQQREVTRLLV